MLAWLLDGLLPRLPLVHSWMVLRCEPVFQDEPRQTNFGGELAVGAAECVCAACATFDWLQFFHVAPAAAVCVFVANAISSDGLQLGLNSFSLDMVQVVDMMPHVMGL